MPEDCISGIPIYSKSIICQGKPISISLVNVYSAYYAVKLIIRNIKEIGVLVTSQKMVLSLSAQDEYKLASKVWKLLNYQGSDFHIIDPEV